MLLHGKKCLWLPVLEQKFAGCAITKVYSRLRSSSSDLGGHRSKCHPPCIGVARIFDWGGEQTKNHLQWSHQKFLWDKDIVEWKIRSPGLVWHLTKSFLKGDGWNQKLQMKISKLGDLCKQSSLFKRITDGYLGTKPPVVGRFFGIKKKKLFWCHWVTFRSCSVLQTPSVTIA